MTSGEKQSDPVGLDPVQRGFETLRSSQNFRRVLQDGTRSSQGGIVMIESPGSSLRPRLGLVVSKRCGNAVTRNRIKRRLRHAVCDQHLQPGKDYVIIASNRVAHATYADVVQWLERALEELRDA